MSTAGKVGQRSHLDAQQRNGNVGDALRAHKGYFPQRNRDSLLLHAAPGCQYLVAAAARIIRIYTRPAKRDSGDRIIKVSDCPAVCSQTGLILAAQVIEQGCMAVVDVAKTLGQVSVIDAAGKRGSVFVDGNSTALTWPVCQAWAHRLNPFLKFSSEMTCVLRRLRLHVR